MGGGLGGRLFFFFFYRITFLILLHNRITFLYVNVAWFHKPGRLVRGSVQVSMATMEDLPMKPSEDHVCNMATLHTVE